MFIIFDVQSRRNPYSGVYYTHTHTHTKPVFIFYGNDDGFYVDIIFMNFEFFDKLEIISRQFDENGEKKSR
jgi:hypothetical protein